MSVPVEDKATDIEGQIDDQIAESNAIARKNTVEHIEDVLMNQTVVLIKSPGDGSILMKTGAGATLLFTSVGHDAQLEVAIAYNRKTTI